MQEVCASMEETLLSTRSIKVGRQWTSSSAVGCCGYCGNSAAAAELGSSECKREGISIPVLAELTTEFAEMIP